MLANLLSLPQRLQRDLADDASAFWCSDKAAIYCNVHAFADEFFGEGEFVGEVDYGHLCASLPKMSALASKLFL